MAGRVPNPFALPGPLPAVVFNPADVAALVGFVLLLTGVGAERAASAAAAPLATAAGAADEPGALGRAGGAVVGSSDSSDAPSQRLARIRR